MLRKVRTRKALVVRSISNTCEAVPVGRRRHCEHLATWLVKTRWGPVYRYCTVHRKVAKAAREIIKDEPF